MKPEVGEEERMAQEEFDPQDLMTRVAMLVVEARTPHHSVKGRIEGPHCPDSEQQRQHTCSSELQECRRASDVYQRIRHMWRNGIPSCIDVLLFPECLHGVKETQSLDGSGHASQENSLLLERWNIQAVKRRHSEWSQGVAGSMLLQAVRSYLFFSQLSSWLASSEGRLSSCIAYRVHAPGEEAGVDFVETPQPHEFPSAVYGVHGVKVTVLLLPRQRAFPALPCALTGSRVKGRGKGKVTGQDRDGGGLSVAGTLMAVAGRSQGTTTSAGMPGWTEEGHKAGHRTKGQTRSRTDLPQTCVVGQGEGREGRWTARSALESQLRPLDFTSKAASCPPDDLHSPKVLMSEVYHHPSVPWMRKLRFTPPQGPLATPAHGVVERGQSVSRHSRRFDSPMSPLDVQAFLCNLQSLAAPIPAQIPAQSLQNRTLACQLKAQSLAAAPPAPWHTADLDLYTATALQHGKFGAVGSSREGARFRKKKALPFGGEDPPVCQAPEICRLDDRRQRWKSRRSLESDDLTGSRQIVDGCQLAESRQFMDGRQLAESRQFVDGRQMAESRQFVDRHHAAESCRGPESGETVGSGDASYLAQLPSPLSTPDTTSHRHDVWIARKTEARDREKRKKHEVIAARQSGAPSAAISRTSCLETHSTPAAATTAGNSCSPVIFQHSTKDPVSLSIDQALRDLGKIVHSGEAKVKVEAEADGSCAAVTTAERSQPGLLSSSLSLSPCTSSSSSSSSPSSSLSSSFTNGLKDGGRHSDSSTPTNLSASPSAADDCQPFCVQSKLGQEPAVSRRDPAFGLTTSSAGTDSCSVPPSVESRSECPLTPKAGERLSKGKVRQGLKVRRLYEPLDDGEIKSWLVVEDGAMGGKGEDGEIISAAAGGGEGLSPKCDSQTGVPQPSDHPTHLTPPSVINGTSIPRPKVLSAKDQPSRPGKKASKAEENPAFGCHVNPQLSTSLHAGGSEVGSEVRSDEEKSACWFYLESPSACEDGDGVADEWRNESFEGLVSSFHKLAMESLADMSFDAPSNGCEKNPPNSVHLEGLDSSCDNGALSDISRNDAPSEDAAVKTSNNISVGNSLAKTSGDNVLGNSVLKTSNETSLEKSVVGTRNNEFAGNSLVKSSHDTSLRNSIAKSSVKNSQGKSVVETSNCRSQGNSLGNSVAKAANGSFAKASLPNSVAIISNGSIGNSPAAETSNDTPSVDMSEKLANSPQPEDRQKELEEEDSVFSQESNGIQTEGSGHCPSRTQSAPSFSVLSAKVKASRGDSGGADEVTRGRSLLRDKENAKAMGQDRVRHRLVKSASLMFNSRGSVPSQSSPAPVKRKSTGCFDFDESLTNTKAIKSALSMPRLPDASQDCSQQLSESRRVLSTSAPAFTNCLLGNFEESILNGRLEPVGVVDGFSVDIGASGSFCPKHLALPVTAYFFHLSDDNAPSPYLGHINLEDVGKRGYHIPNKGTLQVTLFNPNRTVVKMFVVMYDLEDMPANCQTVVRQRTVYQPVDDDSALPSYLRYLIHLRVCSSCRGKIYLHTDVRLIFARNKFELDSSVAKYELRSFTETPANPKYSPKR